MNALDEAFMGSLERPTFAGRELHPFNPIRKFAADCMGLRFFKLHSEAWEDYQKRGTYAGALDDAMLIVWLRWVDDGEVYRCRTHPEEQGRKLWQWAANLEITPGTEIHKEVTRLAMEVITETMEALVEPVGKSETEAQPNELPSLPTGPSFAESSTESLDSAPEESLPES